MVTTTIHPFNGHTEEIRQISAQLYTDVNKLREAAGLPILLDVVRVENATLKARNAELSAENIALRQALDVLRKVPSLAPTVAAAESTTSTTEPTMPTPSGAQFAPALEPLPAPTVTRKKGGRPTNHALIAFLKAGHYQRASNKQIGRMFKVSPNTVRRHLWELGLTRTGEPPRRRRRAK